MKKILILGLFILFYFACSDNQPALISGNTMGTTYSIKIADQGIKDFQLELLKNKVDSLLIDVNNQMSNWQKTSEISQFNQFKSSDTFSVSQGFIDVLYSAKNIYLESRKLFDPTVAPLVDLWGFGKSGRREEPPSANEIKEVLQYIGMDKLILHKNSISKRHPELQLDLGAIAKGYGVDVVAKMLYDSGYRDFFVEIGGEVVLKGKNNGKLWRIGIDRPTTELTVQRQFQQILELSDVAVATSGDYRNYFTSGDTLYSHEISPLSGRPAQNSVASVTVIAPNCTMADGMATAIMIMGEESGLQWIESKPGYEAFIILRKEEKFKEIFSSGFDKYLEVIEE